MFVSVSWGHSKRLPTKSQQEQTTAEQQKTTADQRGTDQLPLVVQPLPTKKTTDIAQHEAREAEEKANSDWWTWILSILTIVALFGQLGVFIAQAYFLWGTLKATAIAARAAKDAAEAVPRLERAYMLINRTVGDIMPPSVILGETIGCGLFKITYCFHNYGRTPAIIKICTRTCVG